jgi:hypothetical protein
MPHFGTPAQKRGIQKHHPNTIIHAHVQYFFIVADHKKEQARIGDMLQ